MVSLLGDCCCAELDPCFSKEPIVLIDNGFNDNASFYYYVYSRSTYFEVIFYTNLCSVDTSLLTFRVDKAVGVTSDTVSLLAYSKLPEYEHFLSEFFIYSEYWHYHSTAVGSCSEVICETYFCSSIEDYYRTSYQGGYYFHTKIHQIKKFVPYDYILPAPIYPVGCEGMF